jgi:hypothetical protein
LAEAIYRGYDVDFLRSGRGANPYGGYYDVADSAGKMYKLAKGDQKAFGLPLGDPRGITAVRAWAHEVADALAKLREKPLIAPNIRNREFLKWAIANCVQGGLNPSSAELVMMTPDVTNFQHVSLDGLLRIRSLVADEDDREWIEEQFHAKGASSALDRSRITSGQSPDGSTATAISAGRLVVDTFTGTNRGEVGKGVVDLVKKLLRR